MKYLEELCNVYWARPENNSLVNKSYARNGYH